MNRRVECLDFVAGARRARGLAVVIDVFRAFSVACHAMAAGARCIHPVAAIDEALRLKAAHPDWLSIGERHTRKLEGFDFGNSPTEISRAALGGRTLVHTTHAGTQGLCAATGADEVITGSLLNAAAICRHVEASGAGVVSLVRMGHEARERCAGDDLCAELIEARLAGRDLDVDEAVRRLAAAPSAQKFFDPEADWAPRSDFDLCTQVDQFDFVLRLEGRGTRLAWLKRTPA